MNQTPATNDASTDLVGKVLYIEDQPVNVAVIEAMLADQPGLQLLHASTGREGIEMVRRERPDFVLLDMHLPDISGLEVVRALNEDIARLKLRVTILTADRLTMDVIKAMSLGASEYLLKPVEPQQLEDSLRRGLQAAQADKR